MKKALLWIIGILAVLLLAVRFIWGGEITSIRSITSVNGNPYLYRMEYKLAYDLDEIIRMEIDENAELLDYVVNHQLHLFPGQEGRWGRLLLRPQLRLFQEPHPGYRFPSEEWICFHCLQ